jgi:hypothetical protein
MGNSHGQRQGMPKAKRFHVDPRRVVHETIDGETILIHLETGSYYSLGGCGADIWGLLAAGWSDDAVVAEMQRRHAEDPEVVAAAVRELLSSLTREDLVLVSDADATVSLAAASDAPSGAEFSAPALEKYTDLQYFLLLDPVHEVEAAGWPHEQPVVQAVREP